MNIGYLSYDSFRSVASLQRADAGDKLYVGNNAVHGAQLFFGRPVHRVKGYDNRDLRQAFKNAILTELRANGGLKGDDLPPSVAALFKGQLDSGRPLSVRRVRAVLGEVERIVSAYRAAHPEEFNPVKEEPKVSDGTGEKNPADPFEAELKELQAKYATRPTPKFPGVSEKDVADSALKLGDDGKLNVAACWRFKLEDLHKTGKTANWEPKQREDSDALVMHDLFSVVNAKKAEVRAFLEQAKKDSMEALGCTEGAKKDWFEKEYGADFTLGGFLRKFESVLSDACRVKQPAQPSLSFDDVLSRVGDRVDFKKMATVEPKNQTLVQAQARAQAHDVLLGAFGGLAESDRKSFPGEGYDEKMKEVSKTLTADEKKVFETAVGGLLATVRTADAVIALPKPLYEHLLSKGMADKDFCAALQKKENNDGAKALLAEMQTWFDAEIARYRPKGSGIAKGNLAAAAAKSGTEAHGPAAHAQLAEAVKDGQGLYQWGGNNCFMVSVVNALLNVPKGRDVLKSCVLEDGGFRFGARDELGKKHEIAITAQAAADAEKDPAFKGMSKLEIGIWLGLRALRAQEDKAYDPKTSGRPEPGAQGDASEVARLFGLSLARGDDRKAVVSGGFDTWIRAADGLEKGDVVVIHNGAGKNGGSGHYRTVVGSDLGSDGTKKLQVFDSIERHQTEGGGLVSPVSNLGLDGLAHSDDMGATGTTLYRFSFPED